MRGSNCGYVTAGCCGCLYKCIASISDVLYSNLCFDKSTFIEYVHFMNINTKSIQFHALWCFSIVSNTEMYFSFAMNTI